MRPSMNAVVAGLPRSWQTAPSITATCCGYSRSSIRARAWSMTSSVWTQTSPSGCHSGSCGQPTSASSSGKSRSTTPSSSASAKPIEGRRRAEEQLLDLSPDPLRRQIVERNAAADRLGLGSSVELEPRRELDRPQHPQAVVARRCCGSTARSSRRSRSDAAVERIEVLVGERIPGDGVDREVAPPRGFARRAARGSPETAKPRCPRPILDSRRGSETSRPATL